MRKPVIQSTPFRKHSMKETTHRLLISHRGYGCCCSSHPARFLPPSPPQKGVFSDFCFNREVVFILEIYRKRVNIYRKSHAWSHLIVTFPNLWEISAWFARTLRLRGIMLLAQYSIATVRPSWDWSPASKALAQASATARNGTTRRRSVCLRPSFPHPHRSSWHLDLRSTQKRPTHLTSKIFSPLLKTQ